ncbi:spermidine synthase, partial [bacterium]
MGEQLEVRTKELGRGPTAVLAAAMFVTGGCGLVAQYVLSTVSTYILGNSIEQFSVVIALMLLMMGLAGVAQNFVSDRLLVEKFVLTEILLGLLCGFAPSALYAAYAVAEDHFPLAQYFLVVAVGFLIGIEIPLAIRINGKYARTLKGNIASIWSLDYIGSFVGALIWAFWLIKVLPLTQLSFLVGGLNLLVAAGTLAYFWRIGSVERRFPMLGALLFAFGATIYGFDRSPDWSRAIDQKLYEDPIVHSETTKYQRIVVTHGAAIDDLRLYLNGNLQFSSVDEQIYHEQLVHPAMGLAPRRSRVLVLGGGDGLALREILKYPDVREVVLVDLDPDMIRLAKSLPALVRLNRNSFGDARVSSVLPEGMRTVGRRQVVM